MNRKGLVEAQLNWIFILFAGAIILTFFVSLAFWWSDNQNTKLAGEVMYRIETILTVASVSENTATRIDVPRANLRFTCDPDKCMDSGCASSMDIEGTLISQGTEVDIIFSQNLIQSDYLYAWTQSWNMPYKVTNFLYLSAPNVKYYFVYREGDDDSRNLAQSVAAKMSENEYANLEVIGSDEVESKEYNNEYLIKYVMFFKLGKDDVITVHTSVVDHMDNWDVMFIYTEGVSSDIGTVKFSEVKNSMRVPDDKKEYPYFGRASLIGAIYAEDFDNYKCNMEKALLRLRTVNAVYQKRTAALFKSFAGDAKCEYFYDSDVQGYFSDIATAVAADREKPDTASLAYAIEDIKRANTDAILRSCPRLY